MTVPGFFGVGVHILKLVVLAFWFGGGIVAGGIVPFFIQNQFQGSPEEAAKLVGGILLRFSTAQTVAGVLLCGILIWRERSARWTLISIVALVVLTVVNEYIIGSWMRGSAGDTYRTLHSTYVVLFAAGVLLSLGLFIAIALHGPPRRGAEIGETPFPAVPGEA